MEVYSRNDYLTARKEYYISAKAKLTYTYEKNIPTVNMVLIPGDMYKFLFFVVLPTLLVFGTLISLFPDNEKGTPFVMPLGFGIFLLIYSVKLGYEKYSLKKDIEAYLGLTAI